MTAMADPHDGLLKYQEALKNCWIAPKVCKIHTDLTLLLDDADGTARLTYALTTPSGEVKAIAVYLPVDPNEGSPCFQVGYAVVESYRNQGIATDILRRSIDEMRNGFKPHMGKFYIEAVVGKYNENSIKVAQKVFANAPLGIVDTGSGEPSLQYFMLIE